MTKTPTLLLLEHLVAELVANQKVKPSKELLERMASLGVVHETKCVEWPRKLNRPNGYGVVGIHRNKQRLAHRVSYEITIGPIPSGKKVCHSCDNPKCINPYHFFIGTQKQNLEDMAKKGRARKAIGENVGASIYKIREVLCMREQFNAGVKVGALQKQFGGSYQSIWSIVHRRLWTHI